MATVSKRTWTNRTGTHEAWLVTYTDERGKRKSGGQYERKKDADAALRKILDEIERGIHVPKRETWTLAQVVEDEPNGWRAEIERRHRLRKISGGRRHNIIKTLDNHLLPYWGSKIVSKITREEVQAWVDRMLETVSPRTGETYRVRTVEGWMKDLSQILDWAVRKNMGLPRNPLADLRGEAIELPPDDARLPVPLQMPEALLVLQWALRSRRTRESARLWMSTTTGVLLALLAGLREGECCALDWPDIDFDKHLIVISRSYSKWDGIGPTKSRKDRTVPLNPVLHAALVRYHEIRDHPSSGPVLLDENGQRMKAACLGNRHWPTAQQQMGLVDPTNHRQLYHHRFRFHDLRHTAGSFWLAEEGMPLDAVSDFLGHSNISFTKQVYIHQLEHDERAKRALYRLSDRLVDRMATIGVRLPASEPPKLIEPPRATPAAWAPTLPTTTELSEANCRGLEPWEYHAVELWGAGRYVHEIARELHTDNWRVAHLLEGLRLKEKTEARGGTKRSEEVRTRALAQYQERNPDGIAKYTEEWIAHGASLRSTTTLRTWVEQAGLPLRTKAERSKPGQKTLTPEDRRALMDRHRAGEKPLALTLAFGIGMTTVRRIIETELREEPIREQVLAMWRANEPAEKIALATGWSDMKVARVAAKAGLPVRGRGWKSWPLTDDPKQVHLRERKRAARHAREARESVASELDTAPVQHDPL